MGWQTAETQGRNPDRPAYLNSFYQSRGRNHDVTGRLTLRSFFLALSSLGGTERCDLSQEIPMSACCCCAHSPAPFSLSLHCLSGTQKTLPATACCLQLLGLGGLTHLAPNRTEDRARGSGVTSPAPSVASYCPLPPRPQGSQPPGTSGCEFVWKVSADLSRTAQCWPGPNSKRFRSILKQGLSQCATRAALTCNLRSSASQVLGLQG